MTACSRALPSTTWRRRALSIADFFALAALARADRGRNPQRSRRQCHPRRHAAGDIGAGRRRRPVDHLHQCAAAFQRMDRRRASEAIELADYAKACGAKALVLVPVNDGIGPRQRRAPGQSARRAKALKPILASRGMHRSGRTARLRDLLAALQEGGGRRNRARSDGARRLPAGARHVPSPSCRRAGVFPEHDRSRPHFGRRPMRPCPSRICAIRTACWSTRDDRLDNIGQIRALLAGGYAGPFSFEPFAPSVHALHLRPRRSPKAWGSSRREIARSERHQRKFRLDSACARME